ncbi:lysozyme [Marinobacterium lutimaris]|uniref:Lysozyme n=1 Tax=Marinobacterium lutimaris TaxID=568106 RepID=A0A1H5XU66_9GAMM|nr:lysozyme [Marinobacterium lutimaris]SEG15261.1 lysozyme [Marinobacterium lutimaris]
MMKPRAFIAAVALAVGLVASYEGKELKAYRDPVGIPTICFGHIRDVQMGDTATIPECAQLLSAEVLDYADAVDRMFTVELSTEEFAAYTSWTYNVGIGAASTSTLRRLANAGLRSDACRELDRWVYAGGKKWPGLVNRRADERDLCLSGLESSDVIATNQ